MAANDLIGKDDNSLGSKDGDMTWNRSNRYPRVIPPPIKVVGVWDTVGALGVPGTFLSPDFSRYYSFFDPILAPDVEYAFHALSLGEDRKDFLPTLWYTPPADQEMETDAKKRESQVMKQVSKYALGACHLMLMACSPGLVPGLSQRCRWRPRLARFECACNA